MTAWLPGWWSSRKLKAMVFVVGHGSVDIESCKWVVLVPVEVQRRLSETRIKSNSSIKQDLNCARHCSMYSTSPMICKILTYVFILYVMPAIIDAQISRSSNWNRSMLAQHIANEWVGVLHNLEYPMHTQCSSWLISYFCASLTRQWLKESHTTKDPIVLMLPWL